MTLCLLLKQWILIVLEVTRRRLWTMSSAVSPSGKNNGSSFQAPCQGHLLLAVHMTNKLHLSNKGNQLLLLAVDMTSKGHRLLLLAVHMANKGNRLLLVAIHMTSKVHTYRRGGGASPPSRSPTRKTTPVKRNGSPPRKMPRLERTMSPLEKLTWEKPDQKIDFIVCSKVADHFAKKVPETPFEKTLDPVKKVHTVENLYAPVHVPSDYTRSMERSYDEMVRVKKGNQWSRLKKGNRWSSQRKGNKFPSSNAKPFNRSPLSRCLTRRPFKVVQQPISITPSLN